MKMLLFFASSLILLSASVPAFARHHHKTAEPRRQLAAAAHPDTFDAWIAKQSKIHGVPEALIHRVVMRESRYHPDAMNKRYYGLMQITYATARSMGYKGEPKGLLDAQTNLTYGVPYLANAFLVAGKKDDRAVALYSKGYYFEAKRKHQLALMRTADSEPLVKEPEVAETVVAQAAPGPPANPVSQLFLAMAGPAAPVEQPAVQQTAAVEMEPVEVDVPLPPRRPNL
jgi:hypothetical protein